MVFGCERHDFLNLKIADRLRNLGAEAPRARGFREAKVESNEAMPSIGAQREMESTGGGKLQRRIAGKSRSKRACARGHPATFAVLQSEKVKFSEAGRCGVDS